MQGKKENHSFSGLIVVFIALAAGICVAGYLSYRAYAENYRIQAAQQLSSVADLKAGELTQWRKERLGDASLFFGNANFSLLVQRYFAKPEDPETQQQLQVWLQKLHAAYGYDRVMLLDAGYAKKMIVPAVPERSISYISPSTDAILRSGKVAFEDFYYNDVNKKIYLKVLVPICEGNNDGGPLLGVLVMRIDPEIYLYPLISRWPTPSRTAETLLVRREGHEAVFLNELKFQKNTALKLRAPLDKIELPAVRAALGQMGIVEGRDYRGVPVLAAIRAIPDSPWFLSARMDLAEVYVSLKERRRLTIVLVIALVVVAGIGMRLIWWRQRSRFDRERHKTDEALRASEERYRLLAENSADIIWSMDLKTLQFTYFSPAVEDILGYTPEEALALPLDKTLTPESFKQAMAILSETLERDKLGLIDPRRIRPFEFQEVCKDGSIVDVEARMRFIHDADGKPVGVQGITREITERKRYEEKLEYYAVHDALTGLLNRRSLEDMLNRTIARAKRGTVSSLLYMDLDNFKDVNDTVGHSAGDEVLITLAGLLRDTVRTEDVVFRLGGDEFAVLLDGMDGEESLPAAERLRLLVEEHRFEFNARVFPLSLSIGLIEIDGTQATGELLSQADMAMYQAKEQGKNRVVKT